MQPWRYATHHLRCLPLLTACICPLAAQQCIHPAPRPALAVFVKPAACSLPFVFLLMSSRHLPGSNSGWMHLAFLISAQRADTFPANLCGWLLEVPYCFLGTRCVAPSSALWSSRPGWAPHSTMSLYLLKNCSSFPSTQLYSFK